MIKKKLAIVLMVIAVMFTAITASAGSDKIIVGKSSVDDIDIETKSTVIDIPVVLENIDDVYAFNLSMSFDTKKIKVDSVTAGDIFANHGSAVLTNTVDNEAGKVTYMQTLLGEDSGVSEDKKLFTIRLELEPGTYNLDDLGIEIDVVNSVPEYEKVNVSEGTILIKELEAGETPVPTPTPIPTASSGVIEPSADADSDFEKAEDESLDEVMDKVLEGEANSIETDSEQTEAVSNTISNEKSEKSDSEETDTKDISNNTRLSIWAIWLIVIGSVVVVFAGVCFYLIKFQFVDVFGHVKVFFYGIEAWIKKLFLKMFGKKK